MELQCSLNNVLIHLSSFWQYFTRRSGREDSRTEYLGKFHVFKGGKGSHNRVRTQPFAYPPMFAFRDLVGKGDGTCGR